MATILDFPKPAGRAVSHAAAATVAGAQIVIFPGIRYEYHDGHPKAAAQSAPSAGHASRDRLEIAD